MAEPRVLNVKGCLTIGDIVDLCHILEGDGYGVRIEADQAEIISVVEHYSEERRGEGFIVFVADKPPQEETPGRETYVLERVTFHYPADRSLYIEIQPSLVPFAVRIPLSEQIGYVWPHHYAPCSHLLTNTLTFLRILECSQSLW